MKSTTPFADDKQKVWVPLRAVRKQMPLLLFGIFALDQHRHVHDGADSGIGHETFPMPNGRILPTLLKPFAYN